MSFVEMTPDNVITTLVRRERAGQPGVNEYFLLQYNSEMVLRSDGEMVFGPEHHYTHGLGDNAVALGVVQTKADIDGGEGVIDALMRSIKETCGVKLAPPFNNFGLREFPVDGIPVRYLTFDAFTFEPGPAAITNAKGTTKHPWAVWMTRTELEAYMAEGKKVTWALQHSYDSYISKHP